jgi:hypothetical protein
MHHVDLVANPTAIASAQRDVRSLVRDDRDKTGLRIRFGSSRSSCGVFWIKPA